MNYSVIIPAFNAEQTISETIASVISQSAPPAEIIVVNDGSTDRTLEIASSFGSTITIHTQANFGCGRATSVGMKIAKYPIIATVDADDIWLQQKMRMQLDFLNTHPESSIVCSRLRLFHHPHSHSSDGPIKDGYVRSTMVIRCLVYERIGDIIDPVGNRGDLVDWLARCRHSGINIDLIPEVLALRRIIPGSLSYSRNPLQDRGYLEVAKRAILRKKLPR